MDIKITPLVEMMNRLEIQTTSSCEGHACPKLIQSPHPVIGIRIPATPKGAMDFLRFMGMLGIHNDNCHSQNDVRWMVGPHGFLSMTLMPINLYQELDVLHEGIVTLVDHLQKMSTWYDVKKHSRIS